MKTYFPSPFLRSWTPRCINITKKKKRKKYLYFQKILLYQSGMYASWKVVANSSTKNSCGNKAPPQIWMYESQIISCTKVNQQFRCQFSFHFSYNSLDFDFLLAFVSEHHIPSKSKSSLSCNINFNVISFPWMEWSHNLKLA